MRHKKKGEAIEQRVTGRSGEAENRLRTFIRMFTQLPSFEKRRALEYWRASMPENRKAVG